MHTCYHVIHLLEYELHHSRNFLFFFLFHCIACEILVSRPEIKPAPPCIRSMGSSPLDGQGSLGISFNLLKQSLAHSRCSRVLAKIIIIVLFCPGCHNRTPRAGALKQRKLTSPNSGGWKCKIKVLAMQVSSRGFSRLADGCLLTVSSCGKGRECWCLFFSFHFLKKILLKYS